MNNQSLINEHDHNKNTTFSAFNYYKKKVIAAISHTTHTVNKIQRFFLFPRHDACFWQTHIFLSSLM